MAIRSDRSLAILLLMSTATPTSAQDSRADLFERRIRPVLVERCYRCHNSHGTKKGGLVLDHRQALRAGGRSGPAVLPGDAAGSRLLRAIRHQSDDLRMPAEGPKLDPSVIAAFARWIDDGAYDPREHPPTKRELEQALSWEETRRRRLQWWSHQPVRTPPLPAVRLRDWSASTVDRFVLARMEREGLSPGPRADRATLLRRLRFVLTGLPPTPAEVAAFTADDSPQAYERLVDRLLANPGFGERWARHWMDWLRYADSHGSEGDPAIPNAWRYRDYLIRALNADVGYDQLVREHLAGDLLPEPRIDPARGVVESAIGTAQLRMVQHGFAPTDALEEQVRFTGDQIDVLTKAFLGLTVACARCHDHKFDALAQSDFYAFYGILTSCRPVTRAVDTAERLATNRNALTAVKQRIKQGLAAAWLVAAERVPEKLLAASPTGKAPGIRSPGYPIRRTRTGDFAAAFEALRAEFRASRTRLQQVRLGEGGTHRGFDLAAARDHDRWFRHGAGLGAAPEPPGGFHLRPEGDRVLDGILPGGVYSHLLSSKHNAVLMSPEFPFDMARIYLRVMGSDDSRARYSVYGYPRRGTVYPVHGIRHGEWRWVSWDTTYWRGDRGYLELTTAADQPTEADTGATRSSFGITRAVFVTAAQAARGEVPKDELAEFVAPLFDAAEPTPPHSVEGLAARYVPALRGSIESWIGGTMSDAQALFVDGCIRAGLLPATLAELPELREPVAEYRRLEAAVPVPTRVPGVLDAEPRDQPLFVRGDHRNPGDPVPRRFLEAIDPRPYPGAGSGRLQLARDFVRRDNPFTPRVAVNRIWHHVFGRGLVATPDNFGRLGEMPTHPELLDHLAAEFVASGWSIKGMIRRLVLSESFRLDSRPGADAARIDPQNRLLSHFPVRRLEAEAIRDAILAVSGGLDREMYGPPVTGRSGRRSVYLRVKRNDLDPFLTTFDAPAPHSTTGRRAATNVPAQSLTLLNDPFVIDRSKEWAAAVLREPDGDARRIARMFVAALGREPTPEELEASRRYMAELTAQSGELTGALRRIDGESAAIRDRIAGLLGPVRERLAGADARDAAAAAPRPIASWDFDDLLDRLGGMHGRLEGDARLEDGTLRVGGRGHLVTAPLQTTLRAKTLEAWVQLDGLDQRAGGVMTLQSADGASFDAIVYGEQDPRQWLAGSDHFARTRPLQGPAESEAGDRPVHLAITYGEDGTVRAYRDGRPHGEAYRSKGPQTFAAGTSNVLFGLRHSPATAGRHLRGRLFRARLYDRAMTPGEVAASHRHGGRFVPAADLLAAMGPEQRREHDRLVGRLGELARERRGLRLPEGFRPGPGRVWQDFAQCLFNLKEFVYLR